MNKEKSNPTIKKKMSQPGKTVDVHPKPKDMMEGYVGSNKLMDKVVIVTGGDSGIGRAVSIAFAKEGADVVISYLNEDEDALDTQKAIERAGRRALLVKGDIGSETLCQSMIADAINTFGKIDVVVNNAGEQHPKKSIEEITENQLERTFRTNIFSMFFIVKAALPHLKEGSVIINTASVTAYRGSPELLDYSATKGAIVAFTRSLSKSLVKNKIRVNAVAPGPVWTPLIPSTLPEESKETFGKDTPMERTGEPNEIAPAYVFLASNDSSYVSGQVIHVNGGEIING